MVNDDFIPEMRGFEFWAEEIQKELRRQANSPHDPVCLLATETSTYFAPRRRSEKRSFSKRSLHSNKTAAEPPFAGVGPDGERVRDDLMFESGSEGHLSAG